MSFTSLMPRETAGSGRRNPARFAGRRLFWTLVAIVLLLPLPFGGVHLVTWSFAGTLVGLLLAIWIACVLVRGEPYRRGMVRLWYAGLAFSLALAWAAYQSLGPVDFRPDLAHPLWGQVGTALGEPPVPAISIEPWAGITGIVRLLTYGAVFWLAFHLVRSSRRGQTFAQLFVAASALYAAYGLVIQLNGLNLVLWHEKLAYIDSLTSTFVNRNSYATYAGLGLIAATALMIQGLLDNLSTSLGRRELGRRLVALAVGRGGWLLVAWCTLVSALLLTQSRAGIASTLIGVLALFLVYGWAGLLRLSHAAIAVLLVGVSGIGFFAISGGGVLDRLGSGFLERDLRPEIYRLALDMIGERPLLGSGLGSFEQTFRLVQDETLIQPVAMAHSSYLEIAVELGLPAASLLVLAIVAPAFRCLGALRERRDAVLCPAVAVAATVLVGLHATVDFSLQIPAVAMTFALLLGVGAGVSAQRRAS